MHSARMVEHDARVAGGLPSAIQTAAPIEATLTIVPTRECNIRCDKRDGPRVENESLEVPCVSFRF